MMDSQGAGKGTPSKEERDKQTELDLISWRGKNRPLAPPVRTMTKGEKWWKDREPSVGDMLTNKKRNYDMATYPYDEEYDRVQDIRLEPTAKQKAQLRAMKEGKEKK